MMLVILDILFGIFNTIQYPKEKVNKATAVKQMPLLNNTEETLNTVVVVN